jgi:hypothetical protein
MRGLIPEWEGEAPAEPPETHMGGCGLRNVPQRVAVVREAHHGLAGMHVNYSNHMRTIGKRSSREAAQEYSLGPRPQDSVRRARIHRQPQSGAGIIAVNGAIGIDPRRKMATLLRRPPIAFLMGSP